MVYASPLEFLSSASQLGLHLMVKKRAGHDNLIRNESLGYIMLRHLDEEEDCYNFYKGTLIQI